MHHACVLAIGTFMALATAVPAHAFSIGAPAAACGNQQVQSPHSLSSAGNGGFSLSAGLPFYIPGKTMFITLSGSSAFEGVLLSAFDQSVNLMGTWQAPNGYQTACNSQSVTHNSNTLKATPVAFAWTPPAAGAGTVMFNATVVLTTSSSFVISGAMLTEVDDDVFLDGFEQRPSV
jgi:hypothetical protein